MHAELLTATSLKPQHWIRNSFVLILRHVCLSNSSHHSHTASKDPTHTLTNTFYYFGLVWLWNFRFYVKVFYTILSQQSNYLWEEHSPLLFCPIIQMVRKNVPPTFSPHRTDGEKEWAPHSFAPLYIWGERVYYTLFFPRIAMGIKSAGYVFKFPPY